MRAADASAALPESQMQPPAPPAAGSPLAWPPRRQRLLWPLLFMLLTAGLVLAGALAGYRLSERAGQSQLVAVTTERLALYAATLEAELARFGYLPSLIATQAEVQALLDQPDDPATRERAGRSLARVGVRAGASQVLVLSARHELLAASDPARLASTAVAPAALAGGPGQPAAAPVSTVNPLLGAALDSALRSGASDFFAADPGDASTSYFFVQTVQREGRPRGVVVVQISLAPLEATWIDLGLRSQSERLLVVDEQGVVVLSSVPAWKYQHLGPGEPPADRSRYGQAALAPLSLAVEQVLEPGVNRVRAPGIDGAPSARFIVLEQPIVPLAARLLALSDPSAVQRTARAAAWGGAAGGALIALLTLYLLHRRRALRQLFVARNALQQAHDQLERQVDARTRELRQTNEELTRQIAQRVQAEDELLQAGKLAVLGQMSAGISHEINQPLTAMRALSSNALRLLEGGRSEAVAGNLRAIDEMAERMGRIINQLKSFARKEGLGLHAVALAPVVRNVLLMLDHRLQAEPVELQLELPEGLQVRGEPNRLEQVLLNLAGNALDAMAGRPVRRLRLAALREGPRVRLQVDDNGPGLDEAQMARLFEPFFTTKPAGQGLGLGLVISSKIMRELGGTLQAERLPGGMRFELLLDVMETQDV